MTMATTTAFGNLVLSFMSAWMVGNVEAPANANIIELNARIVDIDKKTKYFGLRQFDEEF